MPLFAALTTGFVKVKDILKLVNATMGLVDVEIEIEESKTSNKKNEVKK